MSAIFHTFGIVGHLSVLTHLTIPLYVCVSFVVTLVSNSPLLAFAFIFVVVMSIGELLSSLNYEKPIGYMVSADE